MCEVLKYAFAPTCLLLTVEENTFTTVLWQTYKTWSGNTHLETEWTKCLGASIS